MVFANTSSRNNITITWMDCSTYVNLCFFINIPIAYRKLAYDTATINSVKELICGPFVI